MKTYTTDPNVNTVLNFWFSDKNKPFWFVKSDDFDREITEKFGYLIDKAGAGELWDWRMDNYGRLAEILILDQFSRNVYRNTSKSFLYDNVALVLAQEAVNQPSFNDLPADFKKFTIMPFMHSENLNIHKRAVKLFQALGDDATLDFEYQHKVIIERFGRYPHRNSILGRISTQEENAFLSQPHSSF